jgi:hypothetical protein
MGQKQSVLNNEKKMYAILELFDGKEVDVALAPDTVALLTRDIENMLAQSDVSLQEVYEIEITRPFE